MFNTTKIPDRQSGNIKYSFDQQTDYSNKELYRLMNGFDLPTFVKEASVDEPGELSGLAKTAFASEEFRLYPINTPERTFVSYAFFMDKKAQLVKVYGKDYATKVEGRIKSAAELLGIRDQLNEFTNQVLKKQAGPKEECIFEVNIDGLPCQFYAVKTATEFQEATKHFVKNMSKYAFDWRKDMAHSFVQKAARFGVDELPDEICKYAGMFYPSVPNIKEALWFRSTKIANEDIKNAYMSEFVKMADKIESKEDAFNLAKSVYETEKAAGVYQNEKVAMLLPDVVDSFFTISVEKAAELLDVVKLADGTYAMPELQKISADIYKEAFGLDIDPSNRAHLRDVMPTMPLSDLTFFRERSGISPIS